ncbi:MAG: hypothetical protein COA57_01465 [Flavobacteriales bacterium]|nr:MAG: hypothetical protein COA57_01465 [Flavobacteriales bacterium]
MHGENILIVSYTFPPEKGIGGRRWAKFAKYIAKNGNNVNVICHRRKNQYNLWSDDINSKYIHIHEISGFYPKILTQNPKNIYQKILYIAWIKILSLICRGSIYDKSIFLEKAFLQKAREVLSKHNIKYLFITCAPFRLAYYGIKLKSEFDFFLTIDFRDPWTWGQGYGYSIISPHRKQSDSLMEKKVVNEADLIISPSISILNYLKKKYSDASTNRFAWVPHAFDKDEFPDTIQKRKKAGQQFEIKLIYAGTIYDGYEFFISELIDTLKTIQSVNPKTFENIRFDFYSLSESQHYENLIVKEGLIKKMIFNNAIPAKDLFKKLTEYDYTFIYFPEKFKDFISTKFYEVIFLKIPIIYIGNRGEVWDFIHKNKLGYCFSLSEFKSQFLKLVSDEIPLDYNNNFNISKYDFETITKELLLLVQKKSTNAD